jgi:hypothetical protein
MSLSIMLLSTIWWKCRRSCLKIDYDEDKNEGFVPASGFRLRISRDQLERCVRTRDEYFT